jgi:hypothetical protein
MSVQCKAHSSPRRAPVTIATPTNEPQSGSRSNAASTRRAAFSADGGRGSGYGKAGGPACIAGLTAIQRHRTARLSAPLRIQWIRRMLQSKSPRHLCCLHIRAQARRVLGAGRRQGAPTCSSTFVGLPRPVLDVTASTTMVTTPAEVDMERLQDLGVEPTDLQLPEDGRMCLPIRGGGAGGTRTHDPGTIRTPAIYLRLCPQTTPPQPLQPHP